MRLSFLLPILVLGCAVNLLAQEKPYDVFPEAEPPYYRVRYEASQNPGELSFAVNYTIWIPPGVETLRGVIVHQHGCGEGSCKSGLTGAFDLHWQALARKHDCALLGPSYEQPQEADCQLWCDPRKGSDAAFRRGLADLGKLSGHPELEAVPWALWGHSGGGTWAGIMTLLHPDRVAAAWLRSGVPRLTPRPERPSAQVVEIPDQPLAVPVMLNPGTKEGVTEKTGRFAGVWPGAEEFFHAVRGKGGLIGVAVDPLTSHECGNQRYLAIPWLDACLGARLPGNPGEALREMKSEDAWLAPLLGEKAFPRSEFVGETESSVWLPNQEVAKAWEHYVKDTVVPDSSPPPAPTGLRVENGVLTWNAAADLESGIAFFVIERDGTEIARVPEQAKNPFGRPLFQGLQYSDTPVQPLAEMRYVDESVRANEAARYRVISVNTAGLRSDS